jgi:hypothetical protein
LLVVPTVPPANCSVWLVMVPSNSRREVQPDGAVAVNAASSSPPVSSGLSEPPSSPVTVPVVPFAMMKTPVTLYSFSVARLRPVVMAPIGSANPGPPSSSKKSVISDGTLAGGLNAV